MFYIRFKYLMILIVMPYLGMVSCTHMRSGQYIRLKKGEDLKKLSKVYNVPQAQLLASNKGKKPLRGDLYFIPFKRGIIGWKQEVFSKDVTASYLNSGKFIWPVPSSKRISSHFGKRWGKQHQGIDIVAAEGRYIVATADGTVIYSGHGLKSYGNLIVLSHGGGFFSVYAHNRKNFINKGEKVYKGQVIGQIGQTGRTTGPHLHFEIRKNSRPLNPIKYVYKHW